MTKGGIGGALALVRSLATPDGPQSFAVGRPAILAGLWPRLSRVGVCQCDLGHFDRAIATLMDLEPLHP